MSSWDPEAWRRANIGPEELAEVDSQIAAKRKGKCRNGNAPAGQPNGEAIVDLVRASNVRPELVSWLWQGWLARGKMHIIAGQPGAGKTTLALKMAATVSAGSRWPDESAARQGNVVIWSGEDDAADTLVPRLEASGADLRRIFFTGTMRCGKEQRLFDPAKDIAALQVAIEAAGGASLIIVDPVVSATSADSHKNSETRRGLQPLVDMAASLDDAALLGITHFTKGSEGRSPIDRVTGSVAFGALAARAQDGDAAPRVLMRAKSNIGKDDGGFGYELQLVPMRERHDIIASVVSFGDAVVGNARDILKEAETIHDADGDGDRHKAAEFLKDFLSDGPKPQKEVREAAEAHCHAWATVRRAQKELGIRPRKDGMKGGWSWALAEDAHQPPKMLTPRRLSTFDNGEHLRGESEAITDGGSEAITGGGSEAIKDKWGGPVLSAVSLIREAAKHGVWIGLDGDKLALQAQVKPPDALLDRIKASKPEIVALFRRRMACGRRRCVTGGRLMNARARLPNRRQSETLDFEHAGHRFTLSLSRFPDGGIAELFLSSAIVGSPVEALARDAAVTVSLAFQYGCPFDVLRGALTSDHDGGPATPLGAALDAIAEKEAQ